jgi:hypothetical protein
MSNSEELLPFWELLSLANPFYWDNTLDKALDYAKKEIIKQISEWEQIFNKSC